MIEKLERIKEFDCSNTPQAKMQHHRYHNDCINKTNELVDAVNKIQGHIKFLDERIKTKIFMVDIDKTNPISKYIDIEEQRKWIGKLCRFWDDGCDSNYISLLKQIDDDDTPFVDDNDVCWEHCEPVKPDDDVIYKKEQQ